MSGFIPVYLWRSLILLLLYSLSLLLTTAILFLPFPTDLVPDVIEVPQQFDLNLNNDHEHVLYWRSIDIPPEHLIFYVLWSILGYIGGLQFIHDAYLWATPNLN